MTTVQVQEACPLQSGYQRRQKPEPRPKTGAGSHDGLDTPQKATATLTKASSPQRYLPTRVELLRREVPRQVSFFVFKVSGRPPVR